MPLAWVRIEQAGWDAIYGNVAMMVGSLPFRPGEEEGRGGPGRVQRAMKRSGLDDFWDLIARP